MKYIYESNYLVNIVSKQWADCVNIYAYSDPQRTRYWSDLSPNKIIHLRSDIFRILKNYE